MPSLQGKIATGYYLVALFMVAFALFSYAGLKALEQRLAEGELVADLLQDTLEMRRNEKRYFLYEEAADLDAAIAQAEASLGRLRHGGTVLDRLASPDETAELERQLTLYRDLLRQYENATREARQSIAEAVRNAGHLSSQTAKALSRKERDDLTHRVQWSQDVLVISFVPLVILLVLGGGALSRRVLRPLRGLESRLEAIAQGRYTHMELPSMDREIVSFAQAFNGMLGELQGRQDQLRHSERLASLGTLVSGVAHELNNPLGNISSSCQLVVEGLEREEASRLRAWLGQIDDETERARGIVRALLDYARKRPLRPHQEECVALEEILVRARSLAGDHPEHPAQVELQVPAELVVVADEERLERIFINLFKNAFESGAREVRVAARATDWASDAPAPGVYTVGGDALRRAEQGQPVIRIQVDEDGPGIPADDLPRIFEPFFTTRGAGRGTGIGLFIVQEIVQDYGGCIAVENRPEGGARFTLWLPSRCTRRTR